MREINVDLFAGGGGASEGFRLAMGRDPDIAVNHSAAAIAMHTANHPGSRHFIEDVFDVDPLRACGRQPVGLLWLSPDCTHFSRARGGKPVQRSTRALAWVAQKWAKAVRPRVIFLENVPEFLDWGPLDESDLPIKARKGETFAVWCNALRQLGYEIQHRVLTAADYGAPTTRKRLFLIARCDGAPIVWPEPTHGPGRTQPWRAAAEIIDWSVPVRSIFGRKKPLAEPTLRRIAVGMKRYVIDAARPFIIPVTHPRDARVHSIDEPLRTVTAANRGELALVVPYLTNHFGQSIGRSIREPAPTVVAGAVHGAVVAPTAVPMGPFVMNNMTNNRARSVEDPLATVLTGNHKFLLAPQLIQTGYGERRGQTPRALDIGLPLGTVVAGGGRHALVAAWVAKHYGSPPDRMRAVGSDVQTPLSTVTTQDHHALVAAWLTKFYGTSTGAPLDGPVPTVTAGGEHIAAVWALLERYAPGTSPIVWIGGEAWIVVDIGMRMLTPRELFSAQGFRPDYQIELELDGKPMSKKTQIALAGNSVPPPLAAEIVRANLLDHERSAAA